MLGILYRVCISSLLNILHLDISPPLRRYFPRRWLGWSLLAPGPDQDCPTLPTLLAGPSIGHLPPSLLDPGSGPPGHESGIRGRDLSHL